MLDTSVEDILNSVGTRRPWERTHRVELQNSQVSAEPSSQNEQPDFDSSAPSIDGSEIQLDIAALAEAVERAQGVTAIQTEAEEVFEIPSDVLSIMDQYVDPEPRNLEDSVEEIPLPEEEEELYDTVVSRDETARFSSADWFQKAQEFQITLAGLGGVGSWPALLLARLKPQCISLYDPDRVELVNLAGQLYGVGDVGEYKTSAVIDYMRNNANYYGYIERASQFTDSCYGDDVMICGFDNMEARRTFFNKWKSRRGHRALSEMLFIDGRLTATEFQVFCMTGEDTALLQRYETEFLFADSEASQELCSFKQTAYLANMIAGVIVNLYINFCANLCGSPFKKALPFITKYNTDMMMFNTEY